MVGLRGRLFAASLEARLRRNEPIPEESLGEFATELERLLRALATLETEAGMPSTATSHSRGEGEALQPLLAKLKAYLAEFDGEAADYFEEIRDQMAGTIPAVELAKLETEVRAYEFDKALDSLQRLAGSLNLAI